MEGIQRSIAREPVGIVFDIAAWNYPLLVAVNAVVPAVLAGNAVVLKHSPEHRFVESILHGHFDMQVFPSIWFNPPW